MISDNGVNLSAGEKQRISLARAVYSNADIYLLDDCLSAVDVHVAKHITDQVLAKSGLLGGKTCLMVTHNTALISHADCTSYMEHGSIIKRTDTDEHEQENAETITGQEIAPSYDKDSKDAINSMVSNKKANAQQTDSKIRLLVQVQHS